MQPVQPVPPAVPVQAQPPVNVNGAGADVPGRDPASVAPPRVRTSRARRFALRRPPRCRVRSLLVRGAGCRVAAKPLAAPAEVPAPSTSAATRQRQRRTGRAADTAAPAGTRPGPARPGCTSPRRPARETTATPWPQSRLNFRSAWTISDGTGVGWRSIDSGVDAPQPQIARIALRLSAQRRHRLADVRDCIGHGTGVTGIIAAPPRSATPTSSASRPAPRSSRSGRPTRRQRQRASGIAAGIDWAIAHHGAASSTSRPAPRRRARAIEQAIARAAPRRAWSSSPRRATTGADAASCPRRTPRRTRPTYDNVIAVAAVDEHDVISNFSELGRLRDVAAPGVDVILPALRSGYASDGRHQFRRAVRDRHGGADARCGPGLTAGEVRARLDRDGRPAAETVPDPQYGYGIVNPYRAVTAIAVPGAATDTRSRSRRCRRCTAPTPPGPQPAASRARAVRGFVVLAGFLLGGWATGPAAARRPARAASAEPGPARRRRDRQSASTARIRPLTASWSSGDDRVGHLPGAHDRREAVRRQRIDAHAERGELRAEMAGEHVQRRLGRRVDALPAAGEQLRTAEARHVDDIAVVRAVLVGAVAARTAAPARTASRNGTPTFIAKCRSRSRSAPSPSISPCGYQLRERGVVHQDVDRARSARARGRRRARPHRPARGRPAP